MFIDIIDMIVSVGDPSSSHLYLKERDVDVLDFDIGDSDIVLTYLDKNSHYFSLSDETAKKSEEQAALLINKVATNVLPVNSKLIRMLVDILFDVDDEGLYRIRSLLTYHIIVTAYCNRDELISKGFFPRQEKAISNVSKLLH